MHVSEGEAQLIARRSLDVFFTDSVRRRPDRPALFVSGEYWSYSRLNEICRKIERTLELIGIAGKNRNVALVYGRSAFSYAAAIAIMRSNSVYVPLNPNTPAQRMYRILEDAAIEVVIVDLSADVPEQILEVLAGTNGLQVIHDAAGSNQALEGLLGASPGNRLWLVEDSADRTGDGLQSPDDQEKPAARLAYIIYTSGSTGVPKGVPITHESACRCIEKVCHLTATCEQDRFTEFSALSFDVSIADLFLCWKSGGTLYVPSHSEALVPLKFAITHAITVWSSVPSLANFLLKLRILRADALPHLRLSLFCGEALPVELAQAWARAAPHSRIFNIYGPTECTIFFTYYEYDSKVSVRYGVVSIGGPLPGLGCMIVDNGRVVEADDEPGELWLSGDQLADGYWNNPAATQAAFVRFPPGDMAAKVWYRTGDLVSRHRGLGLLFRGRIDRQIKLRGFRIELQEIESVLRDVIGCALVAVVPVRNAGGMYEKIVAYCDEQRLDEAMIKERCAARLPPYSIPERIFQLDSFPVSGHGKIDYGALATRTT
jgi:D-alanine--poly(phosphoribitol) ligase subunit 1